MTLCCDTKSQVMSEVLDKAINRWQTTSRSHRTSREVSIPVPTRRSVGGNTGVSELEGNAQDYCKPNAVDGLREDWTGEHK